MNFITICFILFTHWVADFVCQTDGIARNKSKSNKVLSKHVLYYTACFIPFCIVYFNVINTFIFLGVTLLLHFITDYFTSRRTSYLSSINKFGSTTVPNFGMFSIIGLDQLIHYISLFGLFFILQG